LSFTQESDESLIAVWERFDTLVRSGPSLSIPDPVLLQHFYMGLNRETTTFLNLASNGSFLHTPATKARELLLKLSQITPTYEAKPPQITVQKLSYACFIQISLSSKNNKNQPIKAFELHIKILLQNRHDIYFSYKVHHIRRITKLESYFV
jgi:hypothetical protein